MNRRSTLLAACAVAAAVLLAGCSQGAGRREGTVTRAVPLPQPASRIRLTSPNGSPATYGIAEVVRRGHSAAIAILAKGVAPNTRHNAYAVWLYNSPTDAVRLGFVNPGVGPNGHLDTAGGLPANAGRYHKLLITLETTANPQTPGPTVLEGSLGRR